MRRYALVLAALAFAFSLRVFGQVLVVLRAPAWLPPLEQWDSGLLPYSALLPIQLAFLALQARVSRDLWRGGGVFAARRPRLGTALRRFSYVYAAGMVVRYAITMTLYPEMRWLGHAIPISFHFVLAGYLYTWGRFHGESNGARP